MLQSPLTVHRLRGGVLGTTGALRGMGRAVQRSAHSQPGTVTGNRGLIIHEPLVFEKDSGKTVSAVDLPTNCSSDQNAGIRLSASLLRSHALGLPGLSESDVMRHYVRLSGKNYCIDTGMYPLGSCTMKLNPRINEAVASLPGFADVHPLQPQETVQGILDALYLTGEWLKALTGMEGITLSPAAGAHGEITGMMTIRAALLAKNEADRDVVLIPTSAHGTNPATAAMAGFKVVALKATKGGKVDLNDLREKLSKHKVAALMLTNPNTCGLFEDDVLEISKLVRSHGGYLYLDGANMNSFLGRWRVGDAGVDVMHMNIHKTFSTPHGGGGPGSGPVVFSKRLAPFAPVPQIKKDLKTGKYVLVEKDSSGLALGRVKAFHGQSLTLIRGLAYMMALGLTGLREVSGTAVLNANYLRARLGDLLSLAFPDSPAMHEVLFDDSFLKDTGVSVLDLSKAILDEGFHPWTMYFPTVVHGALLMEPTESESRESLDSFVRVVRGLAERALSKDPQKIAELKKLPRHTPIARADEIIAGKFPILRWSPEMPALERLQREAAK